MRAALTITALLAATGACDQPTSSGIDVPHTVEITAPVREIEERDTVELEVSVAGAGGDAMPAAAVAWSSSNATVATVSRGRVTAWSPGSVVITASAGDASDTVSLTVVAAVVSLELEAEELVVPVGATARAGVLARDRRGQVIPTPALRWSIADSTIVAVEDSLIRGVRPGRTRVTVEAGSLRRAIDVKVLTPYTLTLLPSFDPSQGYPFGINDLGEVIGTNTTPQRYRFGAVWRNGALVQLDFLPGAFNARGEIVGGADGDVFVWRDGVKTTVLAATSDPSGSQGYAAAALSEAGGVAGVLERREAGSYSIRATAFVYSGGSLRELPEYGGQMLRIRQMNSRGDVAGSVTIAGTSRAFVLRSGGEPTLLMPGYPGGFTADMNEAGDVVGSAGSGGAYLRRGDRTTLLDPLPGDGSAFAEGINDRGEIVGTSGGGESRGILWREGERIDLNRLVVSPEWRIVGARSINNRGAILVDVVRPGEHVFDDRHYAVLTPAS